MKKITPKDLNDILRIDMGPNCSPPIKDHIYAWMCKRIQDMGRESASRNVSELRRQMSDKYWYMADRGLPRRTTYRLLAKLKREDEERRRELAEQTRLALEREEAERIRRARMRGARPFRSVAQLPPRARVRAE